MLAVFHRRLEEGEGEVARCPYCGRLAEFILQQDPQ